MKLPRIQRGAGLTPRLKLGLVKLAQGAAPSDIVSVLFHRPELFGAPIGRYLHALLRGPSEWTLGERELFAMFVSHCNRCEFCTASHRAVAVRALGASVVAGVLDDFRTAKVSESVRAVLGFLKRLADEPNAIGADDVRNVLAQGVSPAALDSAIHIAAVFSTINRVADALGFDVPPASVLAKEAEVLFKRGYKPMPF